MIRQKSRDPSQPEGREDESADATAKLAAEDPSMTEIMMAASFRSTQEIAHGEDATVREPRIDEAPTVAMPAASPVPAAEEPTAPLPRPVVEDTTVAFSPPDGEDTLLSISAQNVDATVVLGRSADADATALMGDSAEATLLSDHSRSGEERTQISAPDSFRGEDATQLSEPTAASSSTLFSGSGPEDAATQMEPGTQIDAASPANPGFTSASRVSRLDSVFKNATGAAPNAIQQALLSNLAGEALTFSSSISDNEDLDVGVVLKERFVLKEILGKGGMGTVFKALDMRKVEASDKEAFVALKVLNQNFRGNPISLIALQRETKRAQTLAHPNIITVYDFDRDGAHVFMSMEYMQGQPLNRFIKQSADVGGTPFKKAWPIIEAMGSALEYAHKKDIVHSDFKPGNVFVSEKNEVKVLDFGIACAAARPEKETEATIFNPRDDLGAMTPAYASLEQLLSLPPDPRDDIYALACVIYELLSGQHPFGRLSAEKARELKLTPKPLPMLGRRQWKALQRGLAFEQKDRIGSAAALLDGLRPRSPLFYGMWAAGTIAVFVTAGSVYLNLTAKPIDMPKPAVELTVEQKQQVKDLLEIAGIHFDVGYLVAPTGSNALWAYREALKIDPYNEDAIKGIKKVADAMEQSAWEAFEKGDRAESLKRVMEGLEAEPQHEGLNKLKAKLER